jgi:hypothetical protein
VLTLENLDHRLKVVEELDMRVTRLEEKDGAGGVTNDLWTELGVIKGYCRDLLGEGFTNGVVIAKAGATIQKIWSQQEIHGLRLDRIETDVAQIKVTLAAHDKRFDGIDTRFDGIDGRLDGMDALLREILDRLPAR